METIDKLKYMTAWNVEPTLSEDELNEILASVALVDPAGCKPTDGDWVPTYDLNSAASQGWLIKAARAAAIVDEPTAGAVTSTVFDNCRAMARLYSAKRRSCVKINAYVE